MSSTKYELKPGDTVAVSVLEERTEVEINIADVPEPKPDPNIIFDVFEIGETHAGVRCTYTNPVSETSTKDSWVNIFPAGYEPTVQEVQQGKWASTNKDGDFEFLGTFANLEPGQAYVCWAYVEEGQGVNFLDNGDGFVTLPKEIGVVADITVESVGQWAVDFNVTLSGNVPSGGELRVWADLESTGEVEEIGIVEFIDVSLESPYPGKIEGLRKDTSYILRWDYEVDGVIYDGEGPTVKTGTGDPGPDPEPEPEPEAYYKHTTPEYAAFVFRTDHARSLWTPGYEYQPVLFKTAVTKPYQPPTIWQGPYIPAGWSTAVPAPAEGEKVWRLVGSIRTPNSEQMEWDRVDEYDGTPVLPPDGGKYPWQAKWGLPLQEQGGKLTLKKDYKPWPCGAPLFYFNGKDSTIEGALWEDVPGAANGMISFPDGAPGIYSLTDHYWLANPFDFNSRPEQLEFPDGLPSWLRYNHLTGCLYKEDYEIRIQSGMPDEVYDVPVRAWHGTRYQETVLKIRLLSPKLLFGYGGDFDPSRPDPANVMREYWEAVNIHRTESPIFILPGTYKCYEWGLSQYGGKTAGDRYFVGYDPTGQKQKPVLLSWHEKKGREIPQSLPSNGTSPYGRINLYSNLDFGGSFFSGQDWRMQAVVACTAHKDGTSPDVLQTGGHNDGRKGNNQGPSSSIRWRSSVFYGGQGNTEHLDYNRGKGAHKTVVEECHYHSSIGSICLKNHCDRAIIINNLFQGNVPTNKYDEYANRYVSDQILNLHAGCNTVFKGNTCEISFAVMANSTKSRGPTEFMQFDSRRPKWTGTRPIFGSERWNRETFDVIHAKGINNPYNDGLYVILIDDNTFRYRVIEDIGWKGGGGVAANKPVSVAKFVPTYPHGVWAMFKRPSVYGDACNGDPNPIEAGIIQDWTEIDVMNNENVDRSQCWWFGQTLYVITDNNRMEVIDSIVPVDQAFKDDPDATPEELAQRRDIVKKCRILGGEISPDRIARESDPGYWKATPRPRVVNMSEPEIERFLSRGW